MTAPTTYQMEKENAALKSENEALREAAGALIDGLDADHGRHPLECRECGVLATCGGHDRSYCDDCDPGGFTSDLPHAAPLRALRALLEAP